MEEEDEEEEKAADEDEDEDAKVEEEEETKSKKKTVEKTVWDWVLINENKPLWTKKFVVLLFTKLLCRSLLVSSSWYCICYLLCSLVDIAM